MDNNIFHSALNSVLGAAGKGLQDFGAALGSVIPSSKYEWNKPEASPAPASQINIPGVLDSVKYNETRGEKNPYSFYRSSGSKKQGDALGAYQTTEGELKTYYQKFTGQPFSRQQYLSKPELQDQYMKAKIQHGQEMGLSLPQIFATHRGGYTHPDQAMVKYKPYVDSAMNQYNNFNKNQI